jgi:hypothetical protein
MIQLPRIAEQPEVRRHEPSRHSVWRNNGSFTPHILSLQGSISFPVSDRALIELKPSAQTVGTKNNAQREIASFEASSFYMVGQE